MNTLQNHVLDERFNGGKAALLRILKTEKRIESPVDKFRSVLVQDTSTSQLSEAIPIALYVLSLLFLSLSILAGVFPSEESTRS